jgi:DNA polymerase III delta prime subunit
MSSTLFHTKYRPTSFENLIGHEQAVTRIKGIISKGNWPTAMLITGAPAAGKTTIARAMAVAINNKTIESQTSSGLYKEINGGDQRSIEDMRDLIQISRHKPQGGAKRIFVIDEAQAILTNKAAAQCLLKPIEDSGTRDTIWVLCSMDPGKFQTTTEGKAISGRCTQFILGAHKPEDLMKQARRIIKGEQLEFLKNSELVQQIVERASDMRSVASQIQAVSEYYAGLTNKPKKLTVESLAEALSSTEQDDDKLAAKIVSSALLGKFTEVQLAVLDIGDSFQVVNKILWASQFLLNNYVLNGKRHPKVFWAPVNRMALANMKGKDLRLGHLAALVEMAVQLKTESMQFTVDAQSLISAKIYRFIKSTVAVDQKG